MQSHSTDAQNPLPLPLKAVNKNDNTMFKSSRKRARHEQRQLKGLVFNNIVKAVNILAKRDVASFPEKQFEGEPRLVFQRVATQSLERLEELASRLDYYTGVIGGRNYAG